MPHSGVHELPTERSVTHDSDLRRGALANLLGFAVRAGHPLLLALTTHLYGAGRWGLFVAAQAGVMLAVRVALLGFDKGLLYWLPQRDRAGARSGLAGIAAVARCRCPPTWPSTSKDAKSALASTTRAKSCARGSMRPPR